MNFRKKEDFYFMSEMKSEQLYENRLQYKCPLYHKNLFKKFHVLNMSYDVFYLQTFSYLKTSKLSADCILIIICSSIY